MIIRPFRIFSGSAHPALAEEIANILGIPLGRATTVHLPDSEIHVMIEEDDRIEKMVVTNTIPYRRKKAITLRLK